MCGIVGLVAKRSFGFYARDENIFNQLLFADSLRGDDSTGVFGVRKSGNVDICKEASFVTNFQNEKEYDDFMTQMNKNHLVVVGHNRKATKGNINDASAHPFYEGDVTLVHNGTLTDHKKLKDVDVDSHAICHAINDLGHVEALNKLNGAYALAWYDNRDKTFRLARNAERPLSIIETEDFYAFASEAGMLWWILARNNIPIADAKKVSFIPCDPGYIYEFYNNKSSGNSMRKVKLEALEVASKEVKKSSTSSGTQQETSGSQQTKQLPLLPTYSETTKEACKTSSQSRTHRNKVEDSSNSSSVVYLASSRITHTMIVSFRFKYHETLQEHTTRAEAAHRSGESPYKSKEHPSWPQYYGGDSDVRFVGESQKYPGVTFVGYTKSERLPYLLQSSFNDMLSGEVIGIVSEKGVPSIVSMINIEPSGGMYTRNNVLIDRDVWNKISHQCDVCAAKVRYSELENSYVEVISNVDNGITYYRKKRIVCPNCSDLGAKMNMTGFA